MCIRDRPIRDQGLARAGLKNYVAMETTGVNESEGSREPDSRLWVESSKKSRQETNEEDVGGW